MNEIIITNENMLNLVKQENELTSITNNIKNLVDGVSKNYIFVGWYLLKAKNLSLDLFEYEDVFDYANKVFNIKKSSVYNMMAVAEKFCKFDDFGQYYPTLKKEFEGFNYSQLVELLSVDNVDVEKYKSLPVAEIRKQKILDKVTSYIGETVNEHINIIEKEIFKEIDEFNLWTFDENDEYAVLDNWCSLGEFKFKKSKPNTNVSAYQVFYEQEYKCYFSKDLNFYFNLLYRYDNRGNENPSCKIYITFEFENWQNHFKVMPRFDIDLSKKWDENYEDFTTFFFDVYKYRLTKYKEKIMKDDKQKEETSKHINELKEMIETLNMVETFLYKDYKHILLQTPSIVEQLERMGKYITIDDNTVMALRDTSYSPSALSFQLYVHLVGNYFIYQTSYQNTFYIYKHKFDLENKTYDGKSNPHIFDSIDYCDAEFNKFKLQFFINRYKTQ